ncbi:MAG: histidine phosphotransferase family protein [Rubrimonas sp.]
MAEDLDLAALLCSRICHDLISPVGAVGNGLELMEPARPDEMEVRDLLADSARTALAALEFFRLAFGAAHGGSGPLGGQEVQSIARGFIHGGRRTLEWPAPPQSMPRAAAKLLLLMLLTASGAAQLGGVLTVEHATTDPLRLIVTAEGRRVTLSEDARAIIAGANAPADLAARDAHLAALARHARSIGATLGCEIAPERIRLTAAA